MCSRFGPSARRTVPSFDLFLSCTSGFLDTNHRSDIAREYVHDPLPSLRSCNAQAPKVVAQLRRWVLAEFYHKGNTCVQDVEVGTRTPLFRVCDHENFMSFLIALCFI